MDSNNNKSPWMSEEMFHSYVHEYMIKRGMHNTAEIFRNEATVPETRPIEIVDSPEGFLHEWWSVFYEVFLSKQRSRQESEPQPSNMTVPRMSDTSMNISIPQIPMNEQSHQQFQASSSFNNNMMAQTASGNLAEHIDPSLVALINQNDPNLFSRMSRYMVLTLTI